MKTTYHVNVIHPGGSQANYGPFQTEARARIELDRQLCDLVGHPNREDSLRLTKEISHGHSQETPRSEALRLHSEDIHGRTDALYQRIERTVHAAHPLRRVEGFTLKAGGVNRADPDGTLYHYATAEPTKNDRPGIYATLAADFRRQDEPSKFHGSRWVPSGRPVVECARRSGKNSLHNLGRDRAGEGRTACRASYGAPDWSGN